MLDLRYEGYSAGPIEWDPEENTFSGTVAGTRDVIHFEGSTPSELSHAFRDSIDCYLAFCREGEHKP